MTQPEPTPEPARPAAAIPTAGPGPAGADPAADSPAPPHGPAPTPQGPRPTGAINPGPVTYKGAPLDAGRGPGLGCFWSQIVALVALIVLTPLSVGKVPDVVTAVLLFATLGLLLLVGQTIIFLLRIVAADRRGRREPLAPRSPTVGQIEAVDEPPPLAEVPPALPGTPPTDPEDGPTN